MENLKPKISVIMPVFNTKEEYLREAIESVLKQTFTDFELIIINDGSKNNAGDVILSYKDERIKYIKQENKGVSAARNRGMREAKGEYIAFTDSDDICFPNRLEKQIEYFKNHPEIAVQGGGVRVYFQQQNFKSTRGCKFYKSAGRLLSDMRNGNLKARSYNQT